MAKINHFINSADLDRAAYDEIIRRGEYFINNGISPDLCRGKLVATMFFQPSTRTMLCFQSALTRAGGGFVSVMGDQGLSMEKGESFEDTIRTFSEYVDAIALRYPADDAADRAAKVSHVPVMNCGSGSREHAVATPMMLLEYFHLFKKLDGLKIGIYGTPGINRCVKAMLPIMGYYGMDVVVDNLGILPIPENIVEKAKQNGLKRFEYGKLDDFIGDVDILICTRGLQKGIIPADQFSKGQEEEILKNYKPINPDHMKKLRQDAYLSMLLPLIFEIDRAVDADPRALYMKKEPFTECGLALFTYLLGIKV